jgi:hypothetical protein
MALFIDLGCLYCKQTQRAFNVFKNTLSWLKIDSVDQKFNWLECGNFSQDAGTSGTERVIAFSQLAVKGLKVAWTLITQTPVISASRYSRKQSQQKDKCVACVSARGEVGKSYLVRCNFSSLSQEVLLLQFQEIFF